MKSFFIALQFLSRIHIVQQTVWSDRDFGKAVIWFPIVGMMIGFFLSIVYMAASYFLSGIYLAIVVVAAWFYITGGLHADGYMDTADGIFSGQNRKRMLEIMKDSRVGANGVIAFVWLVLLKICFFANDESAVLTLIGVPTAARFGTLISIFGFPYARKTGLGRAFKEYAPKGALPIGFTLSLLPLVCSGWHYLFLLTAASVITFFSDIYILRKLGGLTGDTYGAVTEFTEMIVLGLLMCIK
ncbi:MAG: adenosylcobinamide-GDP ribazoletransferase [Megasphaera sp.]|uniref:adenosylcobinamide-GDP ribazoletransferase n=1 Tax=Megasphaera sueciensis TaxID=349094 RepID=UPI003D02B3EC|nr:adenosylcobinamide-GDP ribazoletransferase [Megasphaera sp.]MCI1823159.1 adenosylcobinamide-GDP ribazoletransferase [Megasphaera sp.]